jgi:hypothetical protein
MNDKQKSNMKKLNAFSLLVALALLSGCKSEVDKCVEIEMKVWDSQQQKIQRDWQAWQIRDEKIRKNISGKEEITIEYGIAKPDERSKLEVEAAERKKCMSIASGK